MAFMIAASVVSDAAVFCLFTRISLFSATDKKVLFSFSPLL
jgi:hypothetical protein